MEEKKMSAGAEAPADIKETYCATVKNAAIYKNCLTGICPFCGSIDSSADFAADLATGKWYCFAEGIGGDYPDYRDRLKLNSEVRNGGGEK